MTDTFIVKTGAQFLCDGEDGDIGLAPEKREAKSFLSLDEARKAADDHADPGYEILTIGATER